MSKTAHEQKIHFVGQDGLPLKLIAEIIAVHTLMEDPEFYHAIVAYPEHYNIA